MRPMASSKGPLRLNQPWPRANPPSATPVRAPWITSLGLIRPSHSGRGFATYKRWTDCTVQEDVIQLFGPVANSMGNVSITDDQGNVTTVDKTWTFWQPKKDVMRIVLHHSSIPFEIPQE